MWNSDINPVKRHLLHHSPHKQLGNPESLTRLNNFGMSRASPELLLCCKRLMWGCLTSTLWRGVYCTNLLTQNFGTPEMQHKTQHRTDFPLVLGQTVWFFGIGSMYCRCGKTVTPLSGLAYILLPSCKTGRQGMSTFKDLLFECLRKSTIPHKQKTAATCLVACQEYWCKSNMHPSFTS